MCEPVGVVGLVDFVVAARLSLVLRDSRLKIIILDDLDIGGGARLSVGVNRLIRWIITSRKRAQRPVVWLPSLRKAAGPIGTNCTGKPALVVFLLTCSPAGASPAP